MVGAVDDFRISLNVIGDDVDPDAVTSLLGASPTAGHRKGDAIFGEDGTFRHYARKGCWSLEVSSEGLNAPDFETSLGDLLDSLTQDMAAWDSLSERFDTGLFCGLFLADSNRGVVLSVPLMSALVERDLHLGLDIYAPEEEDLANET